MIFLHSLGTEANLWRPQLNSFRRTNHVVAPDLRGHGDTVWEGDLAPGQMTGDISQLARYVGLDRVVLVGLSMGANVALMTAAIDPALVSGLVLASAFTQTSPELKSVLEGMADEAEKVVDIGDYAARRTNRILLRAGSASRHEFMAGAKKMSKSSMVKLSRALASWNLTPILAAINVPTLVLAGGADPFVSVEMAASLAGKIKHSKLVVLRDAGHICNSDRPGAFNHALGGFLDQLGWWSKAGLGKAT
jgi:pimeloyl-ACP methyl ester carboxylesterase